MSSSDPTGTDDGTGFLILSPRWTNGGVCVEVAGEMSKVSLGARKIVSGSTSMRSLGGLLCVSDPCHLLRLMLYMYSKPRRPSNVQTKHPLTTVSHISQTRVASPVPHDEDCLRILTARARAHRNEAGSVLRGGRTKLCPCQWILFDSFSFLPSVSVLRSGYRYPEEM